MGELATTYIEPRVGMIVHCMVLLSLYFTSFNGADENERAFLVSMAFAPLIRILSLALPLMEFPTLYWYLITSIPLFLGLVIAGNTLEISWANLGMNLRRLPLQILIGLSGLVFGTLEYVILRPKPLAPALEWRYILWPAFVLLVCTGLLEEMIFRGLMQYTAEHGLGRWTNLYVSLIFAVLHIGYQSVVDVIFVLVVGFFFGWIVERTHSLIGVTLAHGATNILLFLVMPFVIGPPAPPVDQIVLTQSPSTAIEIQPLAVTPTATTLELAAVPTTTPAPTPTPSPTSTPAPTSTPTPTRTSTPTATAPVVQFTTIAEILNVRAGPGTTYDIVGVLYDTQEVNLIGRAGDAAWVQICCIAGEPGWVAQEFGEITGEWERLPITFP